MSTSVSDVCIVYCLLLGVGIQKVNYVALCEVLLSFTATGM